MTLCNVIASLRFSQTGFVLDCNNLGVQLFGYQDKNQLLHQSWQALIGEDFGSVVQDLKREPQLRQGYRLTLHHMDGSERLATANLLWEELSPSSPPSLYVVLIELTAQLHNQKKTPNCSQEDLVQAPEDQQQMVAALYASQIRYRNSEERYRSLLESTDAALSMVDYHGSYLYLNGRSAKPFGVPATELIGKSVHDLFPLDQANQILEDVQSVISTNQSISLEPQVDIMGKRQWFRTTIQPMCDDSGKPFAALINAANITDKKEAELALRASEQRYRQMFELHGLPKLIIEPENGAIIDANPAAAQFYGYDLATLRTLNIFDVNLSPQAEVQAKMAQAKSSVMSSCKFLHCGAGDQIRHVEIYTGPVEIEGRRLLYSIITDITEQEQAKVALQETLDQLEHHVTERTAELERVKNRFEAIFNYSGDGILLLDADYRIQQANAAFGTLLALDIHEYCGKPFSSLVLPEDASQFEITLAQVAKTAQREQCDVKLIRADGANVDVEISIAPLNITEHLVTNLVCIVRDISERKKAERSLYESENMLRTVIDAVPDSIYVKDRQHRMVLNNRAHAKLLGVQSPTELKGKTVFDLFPPDLARKFHAEDIQLYHEGFSAVDAEEHLSFSRGNVLWVLTTKVPLRNLQGEIIGLVAITRDITERKVSEDALRHSERNLRESQKKLQMVLDTIPVRVFWKDRDSVLQGCNLLFAKDAGFDSVAIMLAYEQANRLAKQTHPDMYRADDIAVIETGVPKLEFEEPFVRADGEKLIIHTSKLPLRNEDGQIVGLLGTYIDITARRKAEIALAQKFEEEKEMQSYLKALHEITLHLTQRETLDDFYHDVVALGLKHFAFERMGFYLHHEEAGEAIGTYGTDLHRQVVNEYDLKLDLSTLTGVLKQGFANNERFAFLPEAPLFSNAELIGMGQNAIASLWQGGTLGWLSIDNAVYHKPISKAQLEILALYAVTVSSLLTRKRAEVAVRESEERFRVFTESAPIATFVADQQGTILLVNHETERLFGYKRDELIGQSVELLLPGDSRYRKMIQVMTPTSRNTVAQTDIIELEARRKDGILFPVDLQLCYVNIQSKPMIMHLVIDITQRKRAEQALRQSLEQEKELVQLRSRFLSTASHEFRTPLATILVTTETIIAYRDKMSTAQIDARLDKIRQQVMHMRDLMEDVLYLARVQAGRAKFEAAPGDLERLCREIIEEFDVQTEYHGRVIYSSTLHSAPQHFDENLVRKVLNNLISNALKYSSAEKPVNVSLLQNASQIQITVEDQGIGIPPNDLKHLFEPFHRAENVGTIVGTGLGLSIAKQATELHGGTLLVTSQVNTGTVFTVNLPIS